MPCKWLHSHKRLFVISEEDWGDGVFWGRVGLFGLNLHFYFGLLVAGKKKQYLNSKKHKKEEKGKWKSDTPEALPWPASAQDSTRTWRKRRRRTLQSSWHNTLVRLRNVAAVNSPFPEVWRLIPFHFLDLLIPTKFILHDFRKFWDFKDQEDLQN